MIDCVMHMKLIFTIIIIKQSNRDILNCLYYIYIYYRDRRVLPIDREVFKVPSVDRGT